MRTRNDPRPVLRPGTWARTDVDDRDEEVIEPTAVLRPPLHDGLAIASLVLSLVWLGGVGSLLAVFFGTESCSDARLAGRRASSMAEAGILLGIFGALGSIVLGVVIFS